MDNNTRIQKYGFLVIDLFSVHIAFTLAVFIRFNGNPEVAVSTETIWTMHTVALIACAIYNYATRPYRLFMRRDTADELFRAAEEASWILLGSVVMTYFMHMKFAFSRLAMGIFLVLMPVIMVLVRTVVRWAARRFFHKGKTSKILIITDEKGLEPTEERFRTGLTYGLAGKLLIKDGRAVGVVEDREMDVELSGVTRAAVQTEMDHVFINAPTLPDEIMTDLINRFEDMGVITHVAIGIPEADIPGKISRFGEMATVDYERNEPQYAALAVKRLIDIIGSIIGLIICGIIFIFVAPAIKLDSPGPVFFTQTRIGKNGKQFKFYKFRSMYVDAEERKAELMKQNKMDGLMFKMDDDPRVTKVGKFIRKTSLDEFPQFWNVLIGDMSIVGTRPPTEDEFKQYTEHYRRRLSMKCGITGLWQVSGRSEITDFDEVVKLDLEYIDNWSLALDMKIILKTFAAVLARKGAK